MRLTPSARRIVAFAGVGAVSALVDAGVFSLVYALGLRPAWLASACGFAAAFAVNYSGNRSLVFRARHSAGALRRYVVLVGANLALSSGLVAGLVAIHVEAHIAKFASMVVIAALNYVVMRSWVFREERADVAA